MNDAEAIAKANLKRVVYIALCIMTLFIAYNAHQNLVAQLYIQLGFGRLGQICLMIGFLCFCLSSTVSAHYQKKMNMKTGLVLGAAGHTSFIVAGTWTAYCARNNLTDGTCGYSAVFALNVACAIFVGSASGIFWLCQASYVNSCATEKTKGICNGLFFSILQCSQILNSVLATVVLARADQFTLYSILLLFAVTSIVMMMFVQPPLSYDSPSQQVQETPVPDKTFLEVVQDFKTLSGRREYTFFFIGSAFSGVAIACLISFLGTAARATIDSDDLNTVNEKIGYVLIALAIGEISAGFSVGRFADMFDKLTVFSGTAMIHELALVFAMLSCLFKYYPFAIICGFLWGYGDTGIQTVLNSIIGSMLGGKPELFSGYRAFQAMGLTTSSLLCSLLANTMPVPFTLIVLGILLTLHTVFIRHQPAAGRASQLLTHKEKLLGYEMRAL